MFHWRNVRSRLRPNKLNSLECGDIRKLFILWLLGFTVASTPNRFHRRTYRYNVERTTVVHFLSTSSLSLSFSLSFVDVASPFDTLREPLVRALPAFFKLIRIRIAAWLLEQSDTHLSGYLESVRSISFHVFVPSFISRFIQRPPVQNARLSLKSCNSSSKFPTPLERGHFPVTSVHLAVIQRIFSRL